MSCSLHRGTQSYWDRKNIWKEMKKLCRGARVAETKVFPHNLRHLFARCFYEQEKDLVRLADYLGHSSIETTRTFQNPGRNRTGIPGVPAWRRIYGNSFPEDRSKRSRGRSKRL